MLIFSSFGIIIWLSLDGVHSHFMNHANSWSLCCVVSLSKPLLSVGPDSPSSRATNLRRSSVTKLVLKLMRHVNILRQAVCIRPLAGFMFSCNLCLTSRGNSLRPTPDLWWFMLEGVRLGVCSWLSYSCLSRRGTRIQTRCGDTF